MDGGFATKEELIEKITKKKEFSELPEKDVEIAFERFDKKRNAEYQKIKLTRNFLRKIYSSFTSRKLLSLKEKDVEWFLLKHKSTKERMTYYKEIYSKIFRGINGKEISIIDLGAGINGFSFEFFPKKFKINYFGVEAIGQLVKLVNNYFNTLKGTSKNKIKGKVFHFSLFEKTKVNNLIKESKGVKIIFMFKVIDSLEVMQRNYSKELLLKIVPESDLTVLSFATRSLGKRKRFSAKRVWILKFIEEEFKIVNDFEVGGERYILFKKK